MCHEPTRAAHARPAALQAARPAGLASTANVEAAQLTNPGGALRRGQHQHRGARRRRGARLPAATPTDRLGLPAVDPVRSRGRRHRRSAAPEPHGAASAASPRDPPRPGRWPRPFAISRGSQDRRRGGRRRDRRRRCVAAAASACPIRATARASTASSPRSRAMAGAVLSRARPARTAARRCRPARRATRSTARFWDLDAQARPTAASRSSPGWRPLQPVITAYTLSLDTPERMAEAARGAARPPAAEAEADRRRRYRAGPRGARATRRRRG